MRRGEGVTPVDDRPDGTVEKGMRLERDGMGPMWVPAHHYWGAQTQRALRYFNIGADVMPPEMISALAVVKKAAAMANQETGRLPPELASLIIRAADEIIAGNLTGNFPLRVWISGSGTQCNMNLNEVIANRAIELSGGVMGTKTPVHPNDHVNMSQSTNDVFPTAMHVAAAVATTGRMVPVLTRLRDALDEKAKAWAGIIKTGRTHMMDAVPLTVGQEFSGYTGMLDDGIERIQAALPGLYRLAVGGTAVGTGLNASRAFSRKAARHIAEITGFPFIPAPNKFAVQGAHDAMVMLSSVLKTTAVSLYKLANDIRLLSSGPRCGLQELIIPANELGSSIMPGKVNPTQCEALTMAMVQVMGYDCAVAYSGAGGHLEMNAYKPLIIFNVIQSIRLITDSCASFTDFLVLGMEVNRKQIDDCLRRSLMLVTALTPLMGYDKASEVARMADSEGLTLKEAALRLGYVSEQDFDRIVDPRKMVEPDL